LENHRYADWTTALKFLKWNPLAFTFKWRSLVEYAHSALENKKRGTKFWATKENAFFRIVCDRPKDLET
jgi:hypothetical protein